MPRRQFASRQELETYAEQTNTVVVTHRQQTLPPDQYRPVLAEADITGKKQFGFCRVGPGKFTRRSLSQSLLTRASVRACCFRSLVTYCLEFRTAQSALRDNCVAGW